MLDEARLIADATGNAALVNRADDPRRDAWRRGPGLELIEASSEEATTRRWTSNNYARAVLSNGLGRYDAARDAAWEAFRPDPIGYGTFLVGELAEAAARTGDRASSRVRARTRRGAHRRDQLRVGKRHRGTCPRAAERGRRCRALIPRVDRAPLHRHRGCASSWPGRNCSTENGSDGNGAAPTPASRCAPRWRPSPAWAPRRSRPVPSASYGRPASRLASAPRRRRPAHPAGGADRAPGRQRNDEPRDRRAALHHPEHRRVSPPQGVPQARREVPHAARTPHLVDNCVGAGRTTS